MKDRKRGAQRNGRIVPTEPPSKKKRGVQRIASPTKRMGYGDMPNSKWEQSRLRALQVSVKGDPVFLTYVRGCSASLLDTRRYAYQLAHSGTMPSVSHKAFMVAAFELIDGKIVIPNVGLLVNAYVAHTKSQKGAIMMKGSDLEHYDLNLLAQDGLQDVKVTSIPKGHAAVRGGQLHQCVCAGARQV